MIKAVIFDMNGVIIDDERIHQESWRKFCEMHGFKLSEEEFKHNVFGRTESDTFAYLLKRQLNEEELEKFSAERVKIAIDLFKPQLKLTEGLLDLLNQLKTEPLPLAIATSARWPYTNFILDGLEIRHYFQEVVTAEDITKGKPDPEIYLLAADKLNIDPKDCIAFEDSLSGIKSGQSAGMKVIAITTTHNADELNIADKVISLFKEISPDDLRRM